MVVGAQIVSGSRRDSTSQAATKMACPVATATCFEPAGPGCGAAGGEVVVAGAGGGVGGLDEVLTQPDRAGYQAILGFRRAVARRPAEERSRLGEQECARLGRMSESVHCRSEPSREEINVRLTALDRVRRLLDET